MSSPAISGTIARRRFSRPPVPPVQRATSLSGVAPARPRSGRAAGDAAEHGAVGEAATAGIIEIEDTPHHLARSVKTGNRVSVRVDDAGGSVDLDATEGEGEPASHGIG